MMKRAFVLLLLLSLLTAGLGSVFGAPFLVEEDEGPSFVPGEIILRFQPGLSEAEIEAFYSEYDLDEKEDLSGSEPEEGDPLELKLVESESEITQELLSTLQRDGRILYAEPNYVIQLEKIPDDPDYDKLWGLHNTGQTGGSADADIDAQEAWEVGTGNQDVIVAVIDTGVDYNHEDLLANMWANPAECPQGPGECEADGVDDDNNGYVDDFYGINAITGSGDPMDDYGHGTHVAGTIGAVGDNDTGVVGVNWSVRMAGCKFLSASGSGTTADAVKCFNYFHELVTEQGQNVLVTNNSWGGGGFSQALYDSMAQMDGTIHACAAGNANSGEAHFPSAYDLENIISVAATDHSDLYAGFSNYGVPHVDLAAPGVSILSTVPQGSCPICAPSGYMAISGTSMATPHVAGAVALIWSEYENLPIATVKQRILSGADPLEDDSKETLTNARLNLNNTLEDDDVPPAAVSDLSVEQALLTALKLTWTATGDDGTSGLANAYDIRYSEEPITEANWESATQAVGEPDPQAAGSIETFVLGNLEPQTTYYVAMKVVDNVGNVSDLSNVVTATTSAGKVVFEDDMENGPGEWTVAGIDALWHQSDHRFHSPDTAWYYGIDGEWNYNTGGANTGTLTSPPIDLGPAPDALLDYWEWSEVESSEAFDRTRVQVSTDNENWETVFESKGTEDEWQRRLISLAPYLDGGGTIWVRFWFDTIDDKFNNFEGWYIDDVRILVAVPDQGDASQPLPNLVVYEENIGFEQSSPSAGEATTIHAVIFNHGIADAKDVVVHFVDATGEIAVPIGEPQTISHIDAGASASVSIEYDTEGLNGEQIIHVIADPNNFIPEENESDNSAEATFEVKGPALPNLVMESENIGFTPAQPDIDEPVTIDAVILNRGDVAASDVMVQVVDVTNSSSSMPIGEPQTIALIPPGGSGAVQVTYETAGLSDDRRVRVIVDPNNTVIESRESDNDARATLELAGLTAPNLVMDADNVGFAPTDPNEGETVTIIATVLNRGSVEANDILVQFVDATESGAPLPIAQQQTIESIPPGGSGTAQVTYDTTGKDGARRIQVIADPHNFIAESKESDNSARVSLDVAGESAPNLVMLSENIDFSSDSLIEGESVEVIATVLNMGNAAATDVLVHFADISDEVPRPLGEPQVIERIEPGGSATASARFESTDHPGERHIQVVVDPNNAIRESEEGDNRATATLEVSEAAAPNLVIHADNVILLPDDPVEGDDVSISAIVLNHGNEPATDILVQFIDITGGGAVPIAEEQTIDSIPPGGSAQVGATFDTSGKAGTRKIQVLVDSNNLIDESNENDNEAIETLSVTEEALPNLVVLASNIGFFPIEPTEGDEVQVTVTVLNTGRATASEVTVQFLDLSGGELDPIGGQQLIDEIPPGGSATAQIAYDTSDRAGRRLIRVVVDPNNFIEETDETDNRATGGLDVAEAPAPNLVVMSQNIGFSPSDPVAGDLVSVTVTILNTGEEDAEEVLVQFVDATGGGSEPVGVKQTIPIIPGGGSVTVQTVYDTTGREGDRRLRVLVDPHTTIPESNENDNQASRMLTVETAPRPNLMVSEENLGFSSLETGPGGEVTVTATIRNTGSALAEDVMVQFFDASEDPETPVGPGQVIESIEPGGSATAQVVFDAGDESGKRKIRVVADPNNFILESDETDNSAEKSLEVDPAPGPNLTMENDNIGFSSEALGIDDTVDIIATVRNTGNEPVSDVLVQFVDDTDGRSTPIGPAQLIAAIPAGGSGTAQVSYDTAGQTEDRRIEVIVDPNNEIAESNERDNEARATLSIGEASAPNLVMESSNIGFFPVDPSTNEEIEVRAVVLNRGAVTVEGVVVQFADVSESGTSLPIAAPQTIGRIQPGGSGTAQVTFTTPDSAADIRVEVTADPNNFIAESKESDNSARATLSVTDTTSANLVAIANNIGFSPKSPMTGEPVVIHGVVLNRGQAVANDVSVIFMDVSGSVAVPIGPPLTIPTIPPGGSGSVQTIYDTLNQVGERQIEMVVDPNNFIGETSEEDNRASRPLPIMATPEPNLTITSSGISFDPPNPGMGNLVTIRATVMNNGSEAALDAVVRILDVTDGGEELIGKQRLIERIAPGASETVEVTYDTTDKAGERAIRVIVDPADTIAESNETDNSATKTLLVAAPPAPNLVINSGGISFSPSSPGEGDDVEVEVEVENDGDADAFGVMVQLVDVTGGGSTPVGSMKMIDTVLAGGQGTVSFTYTTDGKEGDRTLRAIADPNDAIAESNEDDNQAEAELTVSPPGDEPGEQVNLRVMSSDIEFDPTTPAPGDAVTITVTVHNTGGEDATSVRVAFADITDGETPIGTPKTISSIAAGESETTSVVYTAGEEAGEREIQVVVDPDDTIDESNENDNEATKTLTVGESSEANLAPNLVVSSPDIRVEQRDGAPTLAVIIRNLGAQDASNVGVAVVDEAGGAEPMAGSPLSISYIPAGGSAEARLGLSGPPPGGSWSIAVVVDPDNSIRELDESDNLARSTVSSSQ